MTKQLRVFRQSGEPVNIESRAAFINEWKEFFSRAKARAQDPDIARNLVDNDETNMAGVDMKKFKRFLDYGERLLTKKHNYQVYETLPQTPDEWNDLMDRYEQVPIIVAVEEKNKELVLILADGMGRGA